MWDFESIDTADTDEEGSLFEVDPMYELKVWIHVHYVNLIGLDHKKQVGCDQRDGMGLKMACVVLVSHSFYRNIYAFGLLSPGWCWCQTDVHAKGSEQWSTHLVCTGELRSSRPSAVDPFGSDKRLWPQVWTRVTFRVKEYPLKCNVFDSKNIYKW